MSGKPKRPKKPPVRQIKTAADKIHVREVEATERGRRVKFYRVEGYLPDGTRLRLRFKTLAEAEGELATRRVKVTNAKTALNTIHTPLSADQVRDAEGALNRLKGRYTLADTVEYFLRHYAEPEESKPLQEALSAFLDARERAGVRARSIAQLKATVKAFVTWFTLDQLPVQFASDLRLAKASVDPCKTSSPRALLAELEKRNPDFPRPAVHLVTTADIVRFLQSIRTKDGAATASRRTWNNYRADLHAFFAWTCDRQRRWIRNNPVAEVDKFKDGRGVPTCLSVKQTQELMAHVKDYEGGKVVPFFALALFAGLRTGPNGELYKLARHKDRAQLIDLKHGVIHVQPEISKTHQYRQVIIRPNLMAWLKGFAGEILPKNHDRMIKDVRAKFQLGHDVLRHTFFSMHVAAFKSVGEAAIEGGNTESIVKRHYLNLAGYKDGELFWKIGLPPGSGKKPRVETSRASPAAAGASPS